MRTRRRICLICFLLAATATRAFAGEPGYAPKPVDLLDGPSASAHVVARLAKKQAVEIVGRSGSWTHLRADTATGWVKTIDVRLTLAAASRMPLARVKSPTDSGIRGFSEEELLGGSSGTGELGKLKQFGSTAKDAVGFARAAGLKPRKQDYFDGGDYLFLDLPDDFFDE